MNNLKEIGIKNCTCYYFSSKIKIEDFDFGNILLDEKSYKNIFVHNISCKTLVQNHCVLGLIKQIDLLEFMIGLDI